MKKLISYIMLAASSALFFACSQTVSIKDAANAASEDTEAFFAVEISKSLQKDMFSQKGAQDFVIALLDHPEIKVVLSFCDLPENFVKDATSEAMQNPEDFFFAMAAADIEAENPDFIILRHSVFAKKIKEFLEKIESVEKSQKDKAEFFALEGKFAFAIQGALVVGAADEKSVENVMKNLKGKRKDSLANADKFKKLLSLGKSPVAAGFASCKKSSEDVVGDVLFSVSMENANKYSGAVKIEFGEKFLKAKKRAKSLDYDLPEGSTIEISANGKTLSDFSKIMDAVSGLDSGDDIDSLFSKICKKCLVKAILKLEQKEATIEFKIDSDYDYELGAKLLKKAEK